jgi:hypothetical protein
VTAARNRFASRSAPVAPCRGSDVSGVERNLEVLLGSKYFAAEGLLSRDYGSLSVVSRPEMRQQQTRRSCACGPLSGFLGSEQIADGLL